MADAATKTKKQKPARKSAGKAERPRPEPEADDGGLREEDRARLKELVEQRRKKENAGRRARKTPKEAGGTAKAPARKAAAPARPAPRRHKTSATARTHSDHTLVEMAQGWRGRLIRLHEVVLDRLGRNPERVSTAVRVSAGHGVATDKRASPRKVINWALDLLPEGAKGFTFVDFGCGRGRVVLEATRRPFDSIVGIERDTASYEDAMLNLRHWPRSIMACREVDIVQANAEKWKLPSGDLVIYLFDPFDERAIMNLVARLNRHVEAGNRVVVIYLDPTFSLPLRENSHFRQVRPEGFLRWKVETLSPYPLEVYASTNAERSETVN